jgi:hypothetical protein
MMMPTRLSEYAVLVEEMSWHQPTNTLKKELAEHVIKVCRDFRLGIDTPAMLEDQITEWLAPKGVIYKRCSTEQVVMISRPIHGWPTLRVYWESTQRDLYILIAVSFPDLK